MLIDHIVRYMYHPNIRTKKISTIFLSPLEAMLKTETK